MYPILTSEQMAASDRHTIETLGIPGLDLMERAARSCRDVLIERLGPEDAVIVLVGSGNNGGDGLALARLLSERGIDVTVGLLFPDKEFHGDAATNAARLRETDVPVVPILTDQSLDRRFTWIVDALFGTGLNRPLEGEIAALVRRVNAHPARILAVDLPSGLSGSRSQPLGEAIRADVTVTFHAAKIAHAVTPAAAWCGELIVRDIGITDHPEIEQPPHLLSAGDYVRQPRAHVGHKGSYGSLGIAGGFAGMEGAGNLAAMAALRFGAGKVRILTDRMSGRFRHDSVMVGLIGRDRNTYDALVIGPGLSRTEDAFAAVDALDFEALPVVWDADGLYYLAMREPASMGSDWVMTPHPGEAAMLLETSAKAVQANRLESLHALGEKFPGGWVLLKGYRSLLRAPNGQWFSFATGNPALATAGSGDVLSGMIGALLAQGMGPGVSAQLACLRHGMAADRWVAHRRDYAMIAEDIIADLVD